MKNSQDIFYSHCFEKKKKANVRASDTTEHTHTHIVQYFIESKFWVVFVCKNSQKANQASHQKECVVGSGGNSDGWQRRNKNEINFE